MIVASYMAGLAATSYFKQTSVGFRGTLMLMYLCGKHEGRHVNRADRCIR